MQTIAVTELTPEAFGSYGEVIRHAGVTARVDQIATLQNKRADAKPNMFLARSTLTAFPHRFDKMESHPWSSQTFLPFGSSAMLVAAALPGNDGQPDLSTLKAFLGNNVGFSYRAGIWHLPIASLDQALVVAGFMYEDGSPQDCIWADVEAVTLVQA